MNQEVPVYLFTGFLDSGKTTLIRQTLVEQDFGEGRKTLLLVCEDGEEEYDEWALERVNARLVSIPEESEFTPERLLDLDKQYQPEQVFIEYNGAWEAATFLETQLPQGWAPAQSLAMADAATFEMYLTNMRAMMMEQFFSAEVVIFNRCDENTPKGKFRRIIKAKNPKAQIVYERKDGSVDTGGMEDLPYDLGQDVIDITDMDYGIWYLDVLENPKKYEGKRVKFLALVYRPEKLKKGVYMPGRFVMTCCEDDIAFLALKCKDPDAKAIPHRSWIHLTAEVRLEFGKEYRGKGPVLYTISAEPADKPEDELVYLS